RNHHHDPRRYLHGGQKRTADRVDEQYIESTVQAGQEQKGSEQHGFEIDDHLRDDDTHKRYDAAETDCHERRNGCCGKEQDPQPCSVHAEAECPCIPEIEQIQLTAVFMDDTPGYCCK